MKLYALHCGGERAAMAAFDPFDADVGKKIYIPYFFYVVQHPKGIVLFDSGAHPQLGSDPVSRLGAEAENWEIVMDPEDNMVARLKTLGLAPSDVTHAVHSHLHYDHCGGIEFLNSRTIFYVQRDELSFAYAPPIYQAGYYIRADFDHRVSWTELTDDHDVFGDGRVVIFRTPGHTPGHQSLLVRLDGGPVILIGDAAYLPEKMKERRLPPGAWSPDALVASWDRIDEMQRQTGATVVFTHDLAFESTTRIAPTAWYD